jgi:hypothetical protein
MHIKPSFAPSMSKMMTLFHTKKQLYSNSYQKHQKEIEISKGNIALLYMKISRLAEKVGK